MTGTAVPLAERYAEFATTAFHDGLSDDVRHVACRQLLDSVGVALAAVGDDTVRSVERLVASWHSSGRSRHVGSDARLPASHAALVGGTLAHALDFDDTHFPSVLHPSASVVPAALAAAEAGAPGDLIAAIAAGIEVTNRLGMAGCDPETGANLYFERGQHATSICGTIGAAVAVARLYELDAGRIADAIGIAASMGAGVLEANRTGGSVKRAHCGWAAHGGVVAATLAAAGLTGPPTVLEGRFGFFTAHTGRFIPGAVTDGLGERWELLRTVFKPYPSNHFTHAGIDCALALRAAGLDPDDVESAELGVAEPVLRTIAEPAAEKAAPRTGYHAKFSGPYTLAVALTGGGGLGVGLDDFAGLDPRRLALAARVRMYADPAATAAFPRAFAGVLRVRTRAGTVLEHRVDSSRGGPGHPLSAAEVNRKFTGNASRAISVDAAEALSAAVWRLGSGGSVSAVFPG
jgi:2-methylcitrate dehydratase PrpD